MQLPLSISLSPSLTLGSPKNIATVNFHKRRKQLSTQRPQRAGSRPPLPRARNPRQPLARGPCPRFPAAGLPPGPQGAGRALPARGTAGCPPRRLPDGHHRRSQPNRCLLLAVPSLGSPEPRGSFCSSAAAVPRFPAPGSCRPHVGTPRGSRAHREKRQTALGRGQLCRVCTAAGTPRSAELARCAAVRLHGADGAEGGCGGERRHRGDRGEDAARCGAAALPRRRAPRQGEPGPSRGSPRSKGSVAGAQAGTAGLRRRGCSAPALRTGMSVRLLPGEPLSLPMSCPAASPPGTAQSRRLSPAYPSLLPADLLREKGEKSPRLMHFSSLKRSFPRHEQ